MYQFHHIPVFVATALLLTACGTGTKIDQNGQASHIRWHPIEQVTLDQQQGTFPNAHNLAKIQSGMTKDQLYALLGAPHYNDGWRPREWNYLFHFYLPNTSVKQHDVLTCQYKIVFDQHQIARSFFWHTVSPAGYVCPPEPQ